MSIQNLIQDMPGQAPQAQVKLPPQTGTPEPSGIGGSIAAVKNRVMPLLAQNPRPPYSAIMSQIPANTDMTSVIAGINSAMKDVMQKEGAQRQAAMQQAAAGGPNVAQQTMMGLQQFLAPRQMPMMAGGGIVALRDGGSVQKFSDGADQGGVRAEQTTAEQDQAALLRYLRAIKEKGLLPAGAAAADVATLIPRSLMRAYNSLVVGPMRGMGMPAAYLPDIAGVGFTSATPYYDRYGRSESQASEDPRQENYGIEGRRTPTAPSAAATSSAPGAGTARPSGSASSDSGIAQLAGPPKPSAWDRFAAQAKENTEAEQRLALDQAGVDPREILARKEAADAKAGRIRAREASIKEMVEEAERMQNANLLTNQEALLNMAAAMGGKKTIAQALSGAAGAAGAVRGEQRKRVERMKDLARQERVEIDKLRDAQDELKLAQVKGDVAAERVAAQKVQSATANLLTTQMSIEEKRSMEANREGQLEVSRKSAEAQMMQARAAIARAAQDRAQSGQVSAATRALLQAQIKVLQARREDFMGRLQVAKGQEKANLQVQVQELDNILNQIVGLDKFMPAAPGTTPPLPSPDYVIDKK